MLTIVMNTAPSDQPRMAYAAGGGECRTVYICHRNAEGRFPDDASLPRFPYDALPCQGVHLGRWRVHSLGALKAALAASDAKTWTVVEPGILQAVRILRWAARRRIPLGLIYGKPTPIRKGLVALGVRMGLQVTYRVGPDWRQRRFLRTEVADKALTH